MSAAKTSALPAAKTSALKTSVLSRLSMVKTTTHARLRRARVVGVEIERRDNADVFNAHVLAVENANVLAASMKMSWLQTQQMSWLQTSMWLTGSLL